MVRFAVAAFTVSLAARLQQQRECSADALISAMTPCTSTADGKDVYKLTEGDGEDYAIVRTLFDTKQPDQISIKSKSEKIGNYSNLTIKHVLKVESGALEKYWQRAAEQEEVDGSRINVKSHTEEASKKFRRVYQRSSMPLLENELLMLRAPEDCTTREDGIPEEGDERECNEVHQGLCKGMVDLKSASASHPKYGKHGSDPKFKRMSFGQGMYLCDDVAKCDIYSAGQVQEMPGCDLRFMIVVRAYMGKALQMQRGDVKNPEGGKDLKKYHWKHPLNGTDIVLNDGEGLDGRGHPKDDPAFSDWNSVEVMCTHDDPEFSKDWEIKDKKGRSNTFPYRFREFYVPFADPEVETPHLAIQYIVAYTRVYE